MTSEKFFICTTVAFFGALLNFFTKTSKHSNFKYVLDAIIGIFLILIITSSLKLDIDEIPLPKESELNYENISDSIMREIIAETSDKIEQTINTDVIDEFEVGDVKSEIVINQNDYEIESATVYIIDYDKAISTYQVKAYLKQKYDMDVEVLIN